MNQTHGQHLYSIPDQHPAHGTGTKLSPVQSKKNIGDGSVATWLERDPDHELVTACRNGNRQGFHELVLRHKDRLYTLAVRLLGDHGEAEDITQDTFLRVYERIGEFRGEARFTTWLYRICYNLCLNRLQRKRNDSREETLLEELPDLEERVPDQLITKERQEVVKRALSRLTPEFREVIALYYTGQLSYDEVAMLLELPIGTVRSRLHRGRAELKDILRPYLQEEA
jgi:RNA polymerase sigma-70 factor (ECF subfamily)